jgi:large subunit ribosomal protein L25
MAESILSVSLRKDYGKGAARNLRRQGLAPAVFYGKGVENFSLIVDPKSLKKALATDAGPNTLIRLQGEGGFNDKVVIVKELQKDTLTRQILHVDFEAIDLTQKTVVLVPVKVVGTAAGEKDGGILQLVVREMEIRCLPTEIPPHIEIDVTSMKIGDSLHIADVVLPPGVESTHLENFAVAAVVPPEKEEVVSAEGEESGEEAAADKKAAE